MTPKPCILIHYHEISLKGHNRSWFEKIFKKNIRSQIKPLPFSNVENNAARLFIFGIDVDQWNKYAIKLQKVMGLMNAHLMFRINPNIEDIKQLAAELVKKERFNSMKTINKDISNEFYKLVENKF